MKTETLQKAKEIEKKIIIYSQSKTEYEIEADSINFGSTDELVNQLNQERLSYLRKNAKTIDFEIDRLKEQLAELQDEPENEYQFKEFAEDVGKVYKEIIEMQKIKDEYDLHMRTAERVILTIINLHEKLTGHKLEGISISSYASPNGSMKFNFDLK